MFCQAQQVTTCMLPAWSAFGFSVLVAACWINQLGSSWGYIYICHSLIFKNHIMIYYMLSHLCKYLQTCVYIQIISDIYIYIHLSLSLSLSLFLCNLNMYVDHTHTQIFAGYLRLDVEGAPDSVHLFAHRGRLEEIGHHPYIHVVLKTGQPQIPRVIIMFLSI